MKIAILREAGGVGDVICTGAAARVAKQKYPGCETTLICLAGYKEISDHLLGMDHFHPVYLKMEDRRPRMDPLVKEHYGPEGYVYLRGLHLDAYDLIVDAFCPGWRHEREQHPPIFGRAECFAMAVDPHFDMEGARPTWCCTAEEIEWALTWLQQHKISRPAVGVHVHATHTARCYSLYKTSDLINRLSRHANVILFNAAPLYPPACSMVQCFGEPLPLVAAILKQLDIFVGVDSGLLHLAGALGVRSLGLFGPTDPVSTCRIYGHEWIRASDFTRYNVGCLQPCIWDVRWGWSKYCMDNPCHWMEMIWPTDVVLRVLEVLDASPRGRDFPQSTGDLQAGESLPPSRKASRYPGGRRQYRL